MAETTIPSVKPFLRWAGGKSRLVGQLRGFVPNWYKRYWEPFLGAGALFFSLAPASAYLSDSNADLMVCYQQLRDRPATVWAYLREHIANDSAKYYYVVRQTYNRSVASAAQAARFIYLNKTGFNGVFRVNQTGQYNVPYGYKKHPAFPTLGELREISHLLKRAELLAGSYDDILSSSGVEADDFIYFDPPYPPATETANFTHYTAERFSWGDQEKLANYANLLKARGCLVMVSNTDTDRIRQLYTGFEFRTLPVVRWIAGNGIRHRVNELVITSFPIDPE